MCFECQDRVEQEDIQRLVEESDLVDDVDLSQCHCRLFYYIHYVVVLLYFYKYLEFEIFCTLIFNILKIGLMINSKKLLIYDLKIESMIKNIINPNF